MDCTDRDTSASLAPQSVAMAFGRGYLNGRSSSGSHGLDVHTGTSLKPQPVLHGPPPLLARLASFAEHSRPPCASHSAAASASVTASPYLS